MCGKTFWMESHVEDFGKVQRLSACGLRDLFAAAEAVSDDQPIGRGLADSR